jgi:apolipoprotein N-acyltransferase
LLPFLPIALVLCAFYFGTQKLARETAALKTATPATHDFWLAGLVQPNTPSIFMLTDDVVFRQRAELDRLTRQLAAMRPDFILWPESALMADLPYDYHAYMLTRAAARDSDTFIIAGGTESRPLSDDGKEREEFNALWLFGPDGSVRARYHKQHLVPFGEYIPGRGIIPALDRLNPIPACAAGAGPVLFEITKRDGSQKLFAGALICFEDIFPYLARESVLLGVRVLLNATNDAWFEGSLEPEIHLRQSIFRAVENRVPLLRATNTGVTCAITPYGNVTRLADETGNTVSFPGWMTASLDIPRDFTPTFYTRHGDRFFALPAAGFLLVVLLSATWQRFRKKNK